MVNNSALGIKRLFAASLISVGLIGCGGGDSTDTQIDPAPVLPPVTAEEQPDSPWTLVWSDEFDGGEIDTSKWNQEVNCDGGGNFEQQCYTDSAENSFVSEGVLNIVARPAAEGAPLPYTSARLTTQNKGDFKYGRIEMRAKLPQGLGTWPAFWMLPTDNVYGIWPKSGEIDIVESTNLNIENAIGTNVDFIFGTLHYGDDFPGNLQSGQSVVPANNPAEDWNVYSIEWQEGEIRWYLNDYLYATQRRSVATIDPESGLPFGLNPRGWAFTQFSPLNGEKEWVYNDAPFDQEFYLILNLAVGGTLPAADFFSNDPSLEPNTAIDPAVFADGEALQVDYVRVYECSVDRDTGRGCDTVRFGWDVPENSDITLTEGMTGDDAGALVEGAAPIPRLPVPAAADPLVLFDGEENSEWTLWDCCGGTTPEIVMDDELGGNAAEFRILDNNGTVLGFNGRDNGASYNAAAFQETAFLTFDMKVVSPPSGDTTWLLKVEAGNPNEGAAEVPLNTSTEGADPVTGEWQTYTFPITDLVAAGLDPTAIDVIMIFPAWQTGEGAVYRVANASIQPGVGGSSPSVNIFDDDVNPDWPLWDCCGGTTPMTVTDEGDRGLVAQFEILDNNGTVLGFNGRDAGTAFNASTIAANGVLSFDMKVVNPPGDTTWLLKVEAGSGTENFAEVPLNTSTEGADPVTGEWQTFTFPIADLQAAGLNVTAIDIIMIFPAWQTGAGAVYQVDDVFIGDPDASSGGGSGGPVLTVFDDSVTGWAPWDCCGGTTPTLETDPDNGAVIEFQILDNNGTVLGFNGRDNGESFNAASVAATGKLQFDMQVVSPPNGDTTWLMKVEAGSGTENFAEVPLNTSNEGMDPLTGEWQTYTFDLSALQQQGLLVTGIDIIMIFPAWQTGEGAVYRVDNVVFTAN